MRHDRDLVLAVGYALIRQFGRVVFLRSAGLHTDRLTARIGRIEVLRVASSDAVGGAHLNVGDEVCLLLAFGGDREGGDTHVELCAQRRNDGRELSVVRGSIVQTHDLGERLVDVHIVALRGLRIVTEELRGRIVGGGAVTQRASLLDLVGNEGGDFVDGRDLRHVVRGRGCRGRGALRFAGRRAGRRRIRAGGERKSSCGCEDDEGVCLRDGHDVPSDGSGP